MMVTKDGPKVVEFNDRMGDPEKQVVLPRLMTDLLNIMWMGSSIRSRSNGARRRLARSCSMWRRHMRAAVLVTSGGRALGVVGHGRDIAEARDRANEAYRLIRFDGMHYRKDIAAKAPGAVQS